MARVKDLFFTWEFIRYFISGVVATVVDLGVFTLLSQKLGLSQWYFSNFPAIVASVVVAYVMNRVWVFRSTDHLIKEFLRFAGTRIGISAFFTYLFYPILYYGLQITYEVYPGLPLARLIALLFVILGNRVSGKFYVFKDEHGKSDGNVAGDDPCVPETLQGVATDATATIRTDDNGD